MSENNKAQEFFNNSFKNSSKGKRNFGFYFALITSLLVAFAIIITVFYSTRCINLLMNDYEDSTVAYNNFVSSSIVKSFTRDRQSGIYKESIELVNTLKHENFIKYAFAYNSFDKMIFWASEPYLFGQSMDGELKTKISNITKEGNVEERHLVLNGVNLVIGLAKNKVQNDGYKQMFIHLRIFVFLFLFVSVLIAAWMSTLVNKPLKNLSIGVQEFGKGNLKYRLTASGFAEINQLVDAYNHMASQLSELYESLEAKVEERTKELAKANTKLKETQTMMVHSEKMRSLGELVAGIAHEINNPINFIYGNIMILDNYQQDLLALVDKYEEVESEIDSKHLAEINDFKEQVDIEFLREDIGDLIKSCIEGVERTKNIILDLKNFSRMEEMVFTECNVSKEIDTTLSILNNKLKNRIVVHKNYDENLPKIEAFGGQLNQVFMNILDNAQGAIKDKGEIFITTKKLNDNVISVEFEDTGCGIAKENLNKIYEPFYTTKPVGQGTGLGMSIAYRVIEAHKGKISAESEIGKGTKITIVLPIRHKKEENENDLIESGSKDILNG